MIKPLKLLTGTINSTDTKVIAAKLAALSKRYEGQPISVMHFTGKRKGTTDYEITVFKR